MRSTHKKAFTLVELSIVLVILGLLVGGVLAGQSLIHSAELRSLTKQMDQFTVGINAFKEKYMGLPGDLTNATAFWGKDNAVCSGDSGSVATPGTCNGNGDGYYGEAAGCCTAQYVEVYRAWQQLALAGLVEGNFTGTSGSGNSYTSVVGTNVPAARIGSNVGFTLLGANGIGTSYGSGSMFPMSRPNIVNIGGQQPGDTTEANFLKAEDAWNLDTKVDDGLPGRGIWQTWKPNADCNTSNDPAVSVYNLQTTTLACALNVGL